MQVAMASRMTVSGQWCGSAGGSPESHTASCVLFPGNMVRKPSWEQLGNVDRALRQPIQAAAVIAFGGHCTRRHRRGP